MGGKNYFHSRELIVREQLLTRQDFFDDTSFNSVIEDRVLQGKRPPIPECPAAYQALIEMCWSQYPPQRPTFTKIVELLSELEAQFPPVNSSPDIDWVRHSISKKFTRSRLSLSASQIFNTSALNLSPSSSSASFHTENSSDSLTSSSHSYDASLTSSAASDTSSAVNRRSSQTAFDFLTKLGKKVSDSQEHEQLGKNNDDDDDGDESSSSSSPESSPTTERRSNPNSPRNAPEKEPKSSKVRDTPSLTAFDFLAKLGAKQK